MSTRSIGLLFPLIVWLTGSAHADETELQPPAPAVAPAPVAPVPKLPVVVVEEIRFSIAVADPRALAEELAGRVTAVEGRRIREDISADEDEILVDVGFWIPQAKWPEIEKWLKGYNPTSVFVEANLEADLSSPHNPMVEILLDAHQPYEEGPEAGFRVGPIGGLATGLGAEGKDQPWFVGAQVQMYRGFGFEFTAAPAWESETTLYELTLGFGTYSEFLGRGERVWMNPYLGLRPGLAWQDGFLALIQGDVGLEIYNDGLWLLDTWIRPGAHARKGEAWASVEIGGGVFAPF